MDVCEATLKQRERDMPGLETYWYENSEDRHNLVLASEVFCALKDDLWSCGLLESKKNEDMRMPTRFAYLHTKINSCKSQRKYETCNWH